MAVIHSQAVDHAQTAHKDLPCGDGFMRRFLDSCATTLESSQMDKEPKTLADKLADLLLIGIGVLCATSILVTLVALLKDQA